ncbi:tyrosine-type recombinase/integrase [Thermoproteota archaeon]
MKIGISDNLMNLLFSLSKFRKTVFVNTRKRTAAFHNRMKTLVEKHNNPRFLKIHLHTFRHCKALREYHKTRDILHVMGILGHRNINTTYRYVRLYNQIYRHQHKVKFVTKIASTKEERCGLINDGWVLVEKDGDDWYFKKPE